MYISIWLVIIIAVILYFYIRKLKKYNEMSHNRPSETSTAPFVSSRANPNTSEDGARDLSTQTHSVGMTQAVAEQQSVGFQKDNNGVSVQEKIKKLLQEKQEEKDFDRLLAKMKKNNSKSEGNRLDFDFAINVIQTHLANVEKIKTDANKVRQEREKLDEELGFSKRLRQFVGDINNDYGTTYSNIKNYKAIGDQLTVKNFSELNLKSELTPQRKFANDEKVIEYQFTVGPNKYCLYVNKANKRELHYDSLNQTSLAYVIFIIENNLRLVFKAELFDEANEYPHVGAVFSYDHHDLEAFKPGKWTEYLLKTMFEVRLEEQASQKAYREKMDNLRNENNKKNFID